MNLEFSRGKFTMLTFITKNNKELSFDLKGLNETDCQQVY